MKTTIAIALLAALSGSAAVVADGTVPEVAGTVESVGTLGIGGYLLVQIGRLTARVGTWLDSLDKHHASVQQDQKRIVRAMRELVAVMRQAHGIPDAVVRDFTPAPRDPAEPERRTAGPRSKDRDRNG